MLIINPTLAILIIPIVFIINAALHYGNIYHIGTHTITLEDYLAVVDAAKTIYKNNDDSLESVRNKIKKPLSLLRYDSFIGKFMSGNDLNLSEGSFFSNILTLYFSLTPLSYTYIVRNLRRYHKEWRCIFDEIGLVEIAYTTASLRARYENTCTPELDITLSGPQFTDLVHPLVENAVPYSVNLESHLIITGSNASGKSTFVRAIALNAILGQRLNTCTATSFRLRPCAILTSMAISDDVLKGDSYFVSEVKSIKRLIDFSQRDAYGMMFIDEILKGTNTIERIASSAAVFNYLKDKELFICTATHDIELTRILQESYTNYHFKETVTDDGIHFDYRLNKGPSNTKNAIALLDYYKYPKDIINDAIRFASHFENTGSWK